MLVSSRPDQADAYVNHGRWLADCTRLGCANAEALEPRQTVLHCSNCHQITGVSWPEDADEITRVLGVRPVPQTRNWAPANHRQAVDCRLADGQTVADLIVENNEKGVS